MTSFLSIIPNSKRSEIKKTLTELIDEWFVSWCSESASVDIDFNETMFKETKLSTSDLVFKDGNFDIVIFGGGEALEQMGMFAIGYFEKHSKNSTFWAEFTNKLKGTLLSKLGVKGGATDFKLAPGNVQTAVKCNVHYLASTISIGISADYFVFPPSTSTPNLSTIPEALNPTNATVECATKAIGLSFDELLNLKVGDVIATTYPIDESLSMSIGHSNVDVDANLVRQGNQRSVYLGKGK